MRSYWLSNVIHDLSGALFAARGYLRMVLEEPNGVLLEPQRRYLTSSLENVNKLVTLTQELNDFPERDWFDFEAIAFHDLLRQALADTRITSPENNIRVIEEVDKGLLPSIGDAGKLTFAMQAFFASAFQFTGLEGTIRLSAREEDQKIMIQFSATRHSDTHPDRPALDLSSALKIIRLHGGSAFVGPLSNTPSEGYMITCELPVIRLREG